SAAAEPEPLAVGPVLHVVARPAARASHVRNLVLLVAASFEPLHRRQIHLRRVLVWRLRPPSARHFLLERRIWVDLEQVQRQMLGPERRGGVDRRKSLVETLGW